MKKIFLVTILLASVFLLTSCSLLGLGGAKGKEVSEETWTKVTQSFLDETNYKIERTSTTQNTETKAKIYDYKDQRYRSGTKGYYYSKSYVGGLDREGDDWYLIYEHRFGTVNESGVFYESGYSYPGDPEGTFRYDDLTGEYPLEYYDNVTDEKLFSLNYLRLLPNEVTNLESFQSVTWNARKGCYVNSKGGEYYFNESGKLFKYVLIRDYTMGINKLRESTEINISYGDCNLDKMPQVTSVHEYEY